MSKKGFTLVELLVVMVILGIITAISIPIVRNISQTNHSKAYTEYQESIRYAAKIYVDSYSDDLFGHEDSGCVIISYEDLKSKDLIKDFNKDGYSCASEETYVRVVKVGSKYGYSASIGCGKKDEKGNVIVSYKYPKESIVSSENCSVDAETIMTFSTDINDPESMEHKTRSMKVTVSSSTGINSNPKIQYGLSETKSANILGEWQDLSINPKSIEAQRDKIAAGETIEVISSQITTSPGITGNYYLVLRVDRLQDISGRNWTKEGNNNYVYLGPYIVDNAVPEFNDSSVIYNGLKPKLNLKATDVFTPAEQLKMCISYQTDTCSKTNFNGYEAYNATKEMNENIKESLDGSTSKVFITLVDLAGNYATKDFDYELASVITYNGNGATGGSTSQTICQNNTACSLNANGFTKTGYNFDGWYTAASGGSKYGSTTQLTGNITVYAHWIDNIQPTCSAKKISGVNSQDGITVRVTCGDSGSGCTEATHNYARQKSNTTYTVYDNAGNSGTCSVSIERFDCNSYSYACGSYACGSYRCNCRTEFIHIGGGHTYEEICDTCTSYCTSYCTGWNSCYR